MFRVSNENRGFSIEHEIFIIIVDGYTLLNHVPSNERSNREEPLPAYSQTLTCHFLFILAHLLKVRLHTAINRADFVS